MDVKILQESKKLLEHWGYTAIFAPDSTSPLYFEDSVVVGAIYLLDSTVNLESSWERLQESFFSRYAPDLRNAGQKSLNVILVFLVTEEKETALSESLDYNFVASRKIVRTGIKLGTLLSALTPLAPLLSKSTLTLEDPLQILKDRLEFKDIEMEAVIDKDSDRLVKLKLEALRNEN